MEWSKFLLRVNINLPTDAVFKAFKTRRGLESWFLRKALIKDQSGQPRNPEAQIEQGDTYEWYWHGYPDSIVEKGEILENNHTNRFSFTFSMGCPVTISLYEEAGETIVELSESELPTDESTRLNHFVGDSRGWIFYLTNLKSVLEGGLDLRNKKEEITNVITA